MILDMEAVPVSDRPTTTLAGARRRVGLPAAALAALLLAAAPAPAAVMSVYERMAQADLVVRARTIDGTLRLAECRVLEVLKGQTDLRSLYVAFRGDNMTRSRWKDRIVFEDGAESVLMLEPVVDSEGDPKALDRFRLVGGYLGKVDLPREGAEAYIQAFRRLGEILALEDIHQIWEAHKGLILEHNPYLVETGFAEILKFRLGDAAMVPSILEHLDSRHDRFREASLMVLSQVFERAHRRDEPVGNEDHVVARLLTAAMEDPVAEVRVAAVRALQAYGRADVVPALRQMAEDDPSQDVRYQATVSVYRLSREHGSLAP